MNYFFPDGTALSLDEIRNQIATGQLKPDQLVTPEGQNDAVTVSSVLEKSTPPPIPKKVAEPPPIPRQPTSMVASPKKTSLKGLWITLSIIGVIVISLIFLGLVAFVKIVNVELQGKQSSKPLFEDRLGHETKWLDPEDIDFEAAGEAPKPPDEENFDLIKYTSQAGELSAYISPDPGDGKLHPVMVWAKGGFGGIDDFLWGDQSRMNDQSAQEFRDAGIILMCPSFRGENDNPGRFELFYGEVDDFIAAIEHAKSLPYVDPDRIYIGGHSTGGTIVLLSAGSGTDNGVRAAFSFGGRPDMDAIMEDGEGYGNNPYDCKKSPRDTELRSPIRYTKFIESPTFYFEGEEDYYEDVDKMKRQAEAKNVPFEAFSIADGEHFDILAPTTKLLAQKILKDTGRDCNISFTAAELDSTWKAMNDISLAGELDKWLAKSGSPEELGGILENLEEDGIPKNATDIVRMKTVIQHLMTLNTDLAAERISDMIDLGKGIESDRIAASFKKEIVPLFHDYIRHVAYAETPPSKETTNYAVWILDTLTSVGTEESGKFIAELIHANFAADHPYFWEKVFTSLDPETAPGKAAVTALRARPPGGASGGVLAEWSNDQFFNDNTSQPHFYDSPAGLVLIKKWLTPAASEKDDQDNAFVASIALGFIKNEGRGKILELGYAYPNYGIQMEIAWADVKGTDSKRGLEFLQKAALKLNFSQTAKDYLIELDHKEDIPTASLEPEFAATASMIKWLNHGNELGAPPETIEVYDTREIYWPPAKKKTSLYLFKFTYRFKDTEPFSTAYGLYGGTMTWSSFVTFKTPPTAEQLYVNHCALELSRTPGLDESEPLPVSKAEALEQLRKKNPEQFVGKIFVEEE